MSALLDSPRRNVIALWSEITCGEPCWHAREDICRCSCGGKNHGCLRGEDGVRPTRTAKIGGDRYELAAVGWSRDLSTEAMRMNESGGFASIDASMPEHRYHYTWRDTDGGAPARLKPATDDQIAKWPELAAYRQHADYLGRMRKPHLLWRRVEMPVLHFCPDACERCTRQRSKFASEVAQ